jgi:16S rRNA (cytidine1402-2'-O)-methyltransferase
MLTADFIRRLIIMMPGSLYVIATPIGNLEDITLRALRVLGEVDLIACEDTRHTRKLLTHYQISRPTISYHQHNEGVRAPELIDRLNSGLNIALVSDAGTPLISDPGFRLVQEAIAQGIQVVPLPGASAIAAALAAAGLATDEFYFAGFLPSKPSARRARLAELAAVRAMLVFYEAPHRLKETLKDAREALGNRRCVIARELTKLHEQFIRGTLDEVHEAMEQGEARGEIVLLVGPPLEDAAELVNQAASGSIAAAVAALIDDEGLDHKAALKRVARARHLSKSEAYRRLMAERAAEEIAPDDVE